jgi:hypothetical protein
MTLTAMEFATIIPTVLGGSQFAEELREGLVHHFRLIDIDAMAGVRNPDIDGAGNAAGM